MPGHKTGDLIETGKPSRDLCFDRKLVFAGLENYGRHPPMTSLDAITGAEFEARLQEQFHLVLHDGKFPFRLVAVRRLGGAAPGAKREPFAITLQADQPIRLPQGTYTLENATLGPLQVFLVQHAPNEVEAVFN